VDLETPIELETEDEHRERVARRESATAGENGRPRLPGILVACVLAIAAIEAGASLVQHATVPSVANWTAAAERVRAQRKPGAPVLFAPLWVEPIGRLHLGDQLSLDQLTLSDVDGFPEVVQVSVRGARHPWLEGWKPAKSWSAGRVEVQLFQNPRPVQVLFDFTDKIGEAQVDKIGPDVVRCQRQGRRFVCDPRRRWNWVGPHVAEVGHRPYRCVFAHAVDGHVMRITYPAVSVGATLVGYTGIDDFENRKRSKTPVLLRVFVGPRPIGVVRHLNDWPWQRFTIDTRELSGQTHPVSFEVTADNAFARTFCFSAQTRAGGSGAGR
jgi:hypothetical protein